MMDRFGAQESTFKRIHGSVDEKLTSRSKTEMENIIRAIFEDYNLGRASQKALRAVLPIKSQGTVT